MYGLRKKPNVSHADIRDELAKLGLPASTATIRKSRPESRRRPSQGWRTFLRNHAGAIAAMDFSWPSPYVERLIGSIRRECLDRVIVFHQPQLRQLLQSYLD